MIKFKLNLKTIPRYLDILRSQANTQKIRASIAQLCPGQPAKVNLKSASIKDEKTLESKQVYSFNRDKRVILHKYTPKSLHAGLSFFI